MIFFRSMKSPSSTISMIDYYRMVEEQIKRMEPKELIKFVFHIGFVANGMSPLESSRLLDKLERGDKID